MATKWYFSNSAPELTPSASPSGIWEAVSATAATCALTTTPTGTNTTVQGSENVNANDRDIRLGRFVSPPVLQAGAVTGDVRFCLGRLVNSTAAQFSTYVSVWVVSGGGGTSRGVLGNIADEGATWTTSLTARDSGTLSIPTSITAQVGDRIVVDIGLRSNSTTTTSYTGTMRYGGTSGTDLANGDTTNASTRPAWIQFADIDGLFVEPAPTRFYLTNMPAPVDPGLSPAGAQGWEGDFTSGALALSRSKGGSLATSTGSETSIETNWDVCLGRWLSPPLVGSGALLGAYTYAVVDEANAEVAALRVRVVMRAVSEDGQTERGFMLSGGSPAGFEWLPEPWSEESTGDLWGNIPAPVEYRDGDRIVFEVGYRSFIAEATDRGDPVSGTLWYGGTDPVDLDVTERPVVTTRSAWVDLPGGLAFGVDAAIIEATAQAQLGGLSASASGTVTEPVPPGEILDIGPGPAQQHFDAQLSIPGDDEPLFVSMDDIVDGYDSSPWFTGNGLGTAVRFRAPVDGPTIGSTDPRCELREVNADGSDMGFDPFDGGTHTIEGRFKVNRDPSTAANAGITCVQLHDGASDALTIRTQLVSGSLRMRVRVNGISDGTQISNPYTVGTWIRYKIVVVDGLADFYWNATGGTLPGTAQIQDQAIDPTGTPSFYFKAGAYLQDPPTTPGEYGEVEHEYVTVTHEAPPFEEIDGSAQALLGGLSALAAGTVTAEIVPGTAQAALGQLAASALGTVTAEIVPGTATALLGTLQASALGTVIAEVVPGTAQAQLGSLSAQALGEVMAEVVPGQAQALLGTLTAGTTGDVTHTATAAADLGTLTATTTGTRSTTSTASADLGSLTAQALGTVTVSGTASAPLGQLAASAIARRTTPAAASAILGGLVAQANATGASTGTAQALLGDLVATADGTVTAEVVTGAATALLGALVAQASATGSSSGTARAVLGALTSAALGDVLVTASARSQLGALTAQAVGEGQAEVVPGTASALLGELLAQATGSGLAPTITGTAQAQLGGLTAQALADVLVPALAAARLGALSASATGRRARPGLAQAVLGPLVATVLVTPPVVYAEMRPATVPGPGMAVPARSGPTMKGA